MLKPAPLDTDAQLCAGINLLDFDEAGLVAVFEGLGERPFRATQVLKWIHQQQVTEFAAMTNLSKVLRARLAESARIPLPEVLLEKVSADGTRKWVLSVDARNRIETVFIPEPGRGTLCVSSQVGCALDCQFCSTAKQGFSRNLSTAEIISQLWLVNQRLGALEAEGADPGRVTNVVFMGMGEPMLNFEAVLAASNIMLNDNAYGLSRRRVTVSTAGVVPKIDRLASESGVALAISLHATTDALRDTIVPINRKYPLGELLAACNRFLEQRPKGDQITYEYVMLDGINDSRDDAERLVRLLDPHKSKINLIPFNPFPQAAYTRSQPEAIAAFQSRLQAAGFVTTVRKTRGDDIDAACGQLVGQVAARGRKGRLAADAGTHRTADSGPVGA